MTLYKNELYGKAFEFRNALKNEGFEAFFDDGSFRDYLVIVAISKGNVNCGKVSIYYKPSKNVYSVKKQVKNDEAAKAVDAVWDKINDSGTYDAASGIYEAFVDGSYIYGVTGYAAVIYLGNELKAQIAGTIAAAEFRQFGGELQSVTEVLKWCAANNAGRVRINYDYQGIEKFATGEWKAKNNLSKDYVDFIKNTDIEIEWRYIKSHTGNSKNDEADALAKKAAAAASAMTSRRFASLENNALDFMDFINKNPAFAAQYAGAENGETVKLKIRKKNTQDSAVVDLIYEKAGSFSIRQHKSAIEADIYNLWQEFLFLRDFGV
jgi:ribonuclease HI